MNQNRKQLIRSMIISAAALAAFAVVGGGLVAVTEYLTRDRIEANEAATQRQSLQAILPAGEHDNELIEDTITLEDTEGLAVDGPVTIYRAYRDGNPVAAIFPVVAPDGYGGPIHILMGVYIDGRVAGVRVTRHSETPGLGDDIEARRSDWIHGFEGRQLGDPAPEDWAVKADGGVFDQFTGATITPRAVVGAVRRGLVYFRANKAAIFPDHAGPEESSR